MPVPLVLEGKRGSHHPEKSLDMAETKSHWTQRIRQGLLAHLLFLQGGRWVQRRQAPLEHRVCLLHQQGPGLPGAQQDPDDKHKRNRIKFSPSLGKNTGLVCRGSGLGNVSGLGQERPDRISHGGAEEAQEKEMAWNSRYSNWGRKLYQGCLYPILFPSWGRTGEDLGWGWLGGGGAVGQRADLWGRATGKKKILTVSPLGPCSPLKPAMPGSP